jgi:hypothetical protein
VGVGREGGEECGCGRDGEEWVGPGGSGIFKVSKYFCHCCRVVLLSSMD